MTDRERLIEMLDRAGVVYEVDGSITIMAKAGPANDGYDGFVTEITFGPDGQLLTIGAWE